MLCDSDTIIAKQGLDLPLDGFGVPEVYWQKSGNEDILKSFQQIQNPGENTFSKGNSWFILSKEVFSRFRFNENIYGYGFEDTEYSGRLRLSGLRVSPTSTRVIHKFHPEADKGIEEYTWDRNKAIKEFVLYELQQGRDYDVTKELIVLPARHEHWKGALIFFPKDKELLHWPQRSRAKYAFYNRILRVDWETFASEFFTYQAGSFIHIGNSSSPQTEGTGSNVSRFATSPASAVAYDELDGRLSEVLNGVAL